MVVCCLTTTFNFVMCRFACMKGSTTTYVTFVTLHKREKMEVSTTSIASWLMVFAVLRTVNVLFLHATAQLFSSRETFFCSSHAEFRALCHVQDVYDKTADIHTEDVKIQG